LNRSREAVKLLRKDLANVVDLGVVEAVEEHEGYDR
jgi:hypothetical protein